MQVWTVRAGCYAEGATHRSNTRILSHPGRWHPAIFLGLDDRRPQMEQAALSLRRRAYDLQGRAMAKGKAGQTAEAHEFARAAEFKLIRCAAAPSRLPLPL